MGVGLRWYGNDIFASTLKSIQMHEIEWGNFLFAFISIIIFVLYVLGISMGGWMHIYFIDAHLTSTIVL